MAADPLDKIPITPRMAWATQRSHIREKLDEGATAKAIWIALHDAGKFPGNYETFLRYLKRDTEQQTKPDAATAPQPAKEKSPLPVDQELRIPKRIVHNPKAPGLDELFGDKTDE